MLYGTIWLCCLVFYLSYLELHMYVHAVYIYTYLDYPRGLLAVSVPGGALDQVAPDVLHHVGYVHHIPRVLSVRPWDLNE